MTAMPELPVPANIASDVVPLRTISDAMFAATQFPVELWATTPTQKIHHSRRRG